MEVFISGFYFQWHITDACNLRCKHCYQENYKPKKELDLDGLKRIADAICITAKHLRTKAIINLTGGEPFMKKELLPLCKYLDKKKEVAEYLIISNGTLLPPKTLLEFAKLKKLFEVKVSLEGGSAEVNDAIRGSGSYKKAVFGIEKIIAFGFDATIMFTAMKSNYTELDKLVALCRKLKADGVIIERFIPMGNGLKVKNEALNETEWGLLVANVLKLSTDKLRLKKDEIYDWRAFWIQVSSKGRMKLYGAECNVSKRNFAIMPNGDVYPCRRFALKIGNILEEPLLKIMESPVLKDIMNGVKKGRCKTCEIIDCRGCPAFAYHTTEDYLAEDSQCYKA